MFSLHSCANEQFNTEYYQLATWTVASNILWDLLHGNISGYTLSNFFQNDSDYVTKMMYFPFLLDNFCVTTPVATGTFKIGKTDYSLPASQTVGSSLKFKEYVKWFEISSSTHNNFYDYEPYTHIRLYVPFFDIIEIPCKRFYNGIIGYISLDVSSGKATLFIESSGTIIHTATAQVGIPLTLGSSNEQEQQRNNVLQGISLVGSLAGLAGGIAMGNPLIAVGALGLGASAVTKALANNVDRLTVKGATGSRDMLGTDREIEVIIETVKNVKRPNIALKGYPCGDNKTLSSLSGYTEVGEINFNPSDVPIYDDEVTEIVSLLKSGVIL